MHQGRPSFTAMVAEFGRAYHSLNESPLMFDDPLARCWFIGGEFAALQTNMARALAFFDPDRAEDARPEA